MKSMTGFGKSNCTKENYQIVIEIKSVNHRYLDTQIRMPREFNSLEMKMKKIVKEHLVRGRVDCFVTVKKEADAYQTMAIKWGLLDQVMNDLNEAKKERYKDQKFSTTKIMTGAIMHPALFEVVDKEESDEALEADVLATFEEAVKKLNISRTEEGSGIQTYFETYQKDITKTIDKIKEQSELIEKEHQEKLTKKLKELIGESVDETRILTEVALLIERGDINEELDRLAVHVSKLAKLLEQESEIGKEMDFLIQEMNREVNTIGSKSTTVTIKEHVVFLKTVIEKVREQVQNIE
ncbi:MULTISPECIES: YicC/YloC family endoribonuclease [Vagococcus]|uniref:Protein YicC n=1 Tax=Vagococcus fluvialis bH819 TaxID=1255619 RepID=A0A1X6WPR8_9ENTE|nr:MULTISPECIES: YicC/YloC family endoribonuclease [Vagococcus]SLM85646.1 Protein YicC [Vagococcus fluvialis bH819]HCM89612.1 YicC family protein [Vagococcus sp.]